MSQSQGVSTRSQIAKGQEVKKVQKAEHSKASKETKKTGLSAEALKANSERILIEKERAEENSGTVTPTTGPPLVNLNTYTKQSNTVSPYTARLLATPRLQAPATASVSTPTRISPPRPPPPTVSAPTPARISPPRPPPPKTSSQAQSIEDESMSVGETDQVNEKEERLRQTAMMERLLKLSEANSRDLREMRLSRDQDQERARKDKEENANLVGEIRRDVEDLRRNVVCRDEINNIVKKIAEEQTRNLQTMSARDQAWAKRSVEDQEGLQVGMDALRRQIGELKGELEHIRSYPVQNENRTNAQIMSVMTQFDAVQRNVLIRGIPEHEDVATDVDLIKEELRNEFRVVSRETGRRSVIRSIQRVGRKNEARREPRLVKVVFESMGVREDFMREARDKEWRDAETWKAWKELHPNNYMDDHPDKPRLRRYFSDIPTVIRNKKREMKEVCQLLTLAGPSGMPTPVMVEYPNGDAKLLMCSRALDGKWIAERSGVEAETMITNILREYAIRKGWKTRASTSYTQSGAFLPLQDHIAQDEQLRGIFSVEIQRTRMDNVIRREDVTKMRKAVDGLMEEERTRMQGSVAEGMLSGEALRGAGGPGGNGGQSGS